MEPIAIISKEYPEIVSRLINTANDSIDIIVFDWRWYKRVDGGTVSKFNQSIIDAKLRGVNVRALVNSEAIKGPLLANGITAKVLNSKRLLHTKMILVDKQRLVIGSHNFTQHAFCTNHEASVLIDLGTVDNRFVSYFNNLWGA